jgi:hypothetical protein
MLLLLPAAQTFLTVPSAEWLIGPETKRPHASLHHVMIGI